MPRYFHFPLQPRPTRHAMIEAVQAALDDEGLELLLSIQGGGIREVIQNREIVMIVPHSMIATKLADGVGVRSDGSREPGPVRTGMTEQALIYAYRNTGRVEHHGYAVVPGPTGCLCGMVVDDVIDGGDCRSIGCDPCCPTCGVPDDGRCPDPPSCAGCGKEPA